MHNVAIEKLKNLYREAVAIARHMEYFPSDSIVEAVLNVFSFDTHDTNAMAHIARAFSEHDLSLGSNFYEISQRVGSRGKDLRIEYEYNGKREVPYYILYIHVSNYIVRHPFQNTEGQTQITNPMLGVHLVLLIIIMIF